MASRHSHWNWKVIFAGKCVPYIMHLIFQNSYIRYSLIEINRGLNGSYARNRMLSDHLHWMLPCFFFYFFFVFWIEMGFVCVKLSILSSFILHCIGYVKWPYSPCLPSSVTVLVRFKYNLHYTHGQKRDLRPITTMSFNPFFSVTADASAGVLFRHYRKEEPPNPFVTSTPHLYACLNGAGLSYLSYSRASVLLNVCRTGGSIF